MTPRSDPCPASFRYSEIKSGCSMEWHLTSLFALTGHLQMGNATSFMSEISDSEFAQFLASESVIEQGGQNCTVPYALERFLGGCRKKFAGLMIRDRRGFANVALYFGPLHALHGIVGDGILVAEVLKKRRQRG